MSTQQEKDVFWSFSTIQNIKKKLELNEPLEWREFILWKYYQVTDHPIPRGNVTVIQSEEHFDEIINEGKPVAAAFTAPYKYTCEYLKKKIREMAPHFKDDANFVEVDCSITPKLCYERNIISVPAIDVFYKPIGKEKTYRYRYSYSYSVYGFGCFLKDYGFRNPNSIYSDVARKLDELQKKFSNS